MKPPRIAVISVKQPPRVGEWSYLDDDAPLEGARGSDPVPVILRGKLTWAHYMELTDDHGKSVSGSFWMSDDPFGDQDEEIEPKFWLRIERA